MLHFDILGVHILIITDPILTLCLVAPICSVVAKLNQSVGGGGELV